MRPWVGRAFLTAVVAAPFHIASAQSQGLSDTDMAAAYCIGVEDVRGPEAGSFISDGCPKFPKATDAENREFCVAPIEEIRNKRARLVRYITARGYSDNASRTNRTAILALIRSGQDDARSCNSAHPTRCSHCQGMFTPSTPPATRDPQVLKKFFEDKDAEFKRAGACFNQCHSEIPACARCVSL